MDRYTHNYLCTHGLVYIYVLRSSTHWVGLDSVTHQEQYTHSMTRSWFLNTIIQKEEVELLGEK